MSDFLRAVVRRGAGLPAAVLPRTRPLDEALQTDAESRAVDADAARDVATDGDEPLAVAEPRASAVVPETVRPAGPAPERPDITPITPDRPHDAVTVAPHPLPRERPGDDRSLRRVAPTAGEVSPTVSLEAPSAVVSGTTPAVRPATPAPSKEAALSPPAPSAVRLTSIEPRRDPIASVAAPAPAPQSVSTPSPVDEFTDEQRSVLADLPADEPIFAPVRLQPATAPAIAWPVAVRAPEAPHVDVHIGRIEILPPPAAVAPAAAPRRQPRGFAAETSSRSYRDRRWY